MKLNYSNKLLVGTLVLIVISSSFGNAFANNGVRDEFTTGRYSFADPNGQGARETAPTDERYRPYSSSENTIIQSPNVSAAGVEASLLNGCNCVVFRLDDIQDYWLSDVQVAVMDQFVQKDQFLSAGPIVGLFGADATVVDKVIAGYNSGLFEIFAHGWDHVDYTTLTLATQTSTLQDSQNKLQLLFGSPSSVFIPPFNTFNANTLTALQDTGFNIISSAEWADSYPYFIADGASDIVDSNGIYHLPESIAFTDWIDGVPVRVPNSQILAAIDSSISTKGYAIVTLHSQEFAQVQGGTQINVVDQTLLNDLNSIIDGVIAKNYPIRTFSQVVEFNQSLPDTEPPVIAAHSDVNAAATSPSGATVSYTSPTTTDNVDAPGVATCSPLSGTTFAIGITTVTCNATDAAGNSAIPTTFNVIVSDIPDTEPPVIAAHSDVNAAATSPSGATVSYTSPTTTDNVDAPGVATCSPLSGTTFAIGITTVTCNATDAAGNSAIPTTFNVIVSDIPDTQNQIAGWRSSQYGDYLSSGHDQSDPDYWISVAQQMTAKFPGFTPGGVLVIGEIDGAPGTATSTFLPFPKPAGTYPNVNFGTTDTIEPLLDAYDSAGLKVYLQVESADADIPMLMNLIMDRYKHHPSVIGFGVDAEWYHEAQFPGWGRPLTDSEVNAWAAQVKTFDPDYDLLVKHWDASYLSNARPDNVLFLTDSEKIGSLSAATNEYIGWIDHFGDAQVGYQIGYPSDQSWWGSLNDPASEIMNPVITARPNANIGAIFWVDFSVLAAFPDTGNPTITINDVTQTEGNSGTSNFVFSVTRSTNTPAISVQYQTADNTASSPTDYTSISSTLNFASGGPLTQTITVSVNGDSTVEQNEIFNVNLSNCVGCTLVDSQGVGTITNDDSPPPDTEPPVIAAHSDVNAAATSPSGATVSYTSPTTTDNVDAPGV
ncbi:MAG: HYR domain-containing protein, partial [Nitrosopumilus sp.]|nr:HYR domain-containing protein [Nitrosopumilus sp.]